MAQGMSFHLPSLPKRVKTPLEFKYLFLYVAFALIVNTPPAWLHALHRAWNFLVDLVFAFGHFLEDLFQRLELLIQVWLTPV